MESVSYPGFQRLFEDLLAFALARGVEYHAAEDLVGSAIELALKHFDSSRGQYRSLCFSTLSNLIKNHWRDRKHVDPFADGEEPPDPNWQEGFAWFRGEEERVMVEAIMEELTEPERQFLVELRGVFEDLEDRAVSEASRRLGLEPQKGWDLFRKIQRKAERLRPQVKYMPEPAVESTAARIDLDAMDRVSSLRFSLHRGFGQDMRLLATLAAGKEGFGRLLCKISADSARGVEALLS